LSESPPLWITNNILPSSLISAYAVRIGRYSHSVDRRLSRLYPYRYSHGYALVCI